MTKPSGRKSKMTYSTDDCRDAGGRVTQEQLPSKSWNMQN